MRKSLVISEEELREEYKYNCTMKHLNLDNKLDITFDADESDRGSFSLSVVFSVLVFMCVALLIITALIIWRKRPTAGKCFIKDLKRKYSPTPLKPRVRLVRKRLPDSHRLQISCLATGFYPRHINLTLFRDGQPVDDDQITGGEILPNGDGTS
ncbi:hypothetical protein cypCar_00014761, partial [Cyprinus carpio]